MITSVFCTGASAADQRRADLLEYSWGRVRQAGELVRLVAARPGEPLPRHRFARVIGTRSWVPHPYTGDRYPGYDRAACLLAFLFQEGVEGTLLLLEAGSVFRSAVATEVEPGLARGAAWPGLPRKGDGPFGLGPEFACLERFCVDRGLEPPAVRPPVLVHARDLRALAARWLELMGILRAEAAVCASGGVSAADLAYAVAAAEAGLSHSPADLVCECDAEVSCAPILDARHPIAAASGDLLWEGVGNPGEPELPARPLSGVGRELLALRDEFAERTAAGGALALLRPRRRKGVREARILTHTLLEIPGRADALSLNPSAAAVWALCDGRLSLAEVTHALEARYQRPAGSLGAEVETVVDRLVGVGALVLEPL